MSLGEHLAQLLGGLSPLEPLDVSLEGARGTSLAADIVAPQPVPNFDLCEISGYAVKATELAPGAQLKVIDRVSPGAATSQPVYTGVCVAVFEGARLPGGADAVVPANDLESVGATIRVDHPVAPGYGVTLVGSQAQAGSLLLAAGRTVDARAMGLLAAAGFPRVSVLPAPRVVVVTVGEDLVSLQVDTVAAGMRFDSAGVLLQATAAQAGAMASHVGPVPMSNRKIREALEDQLIRADLVVVSGGSETSDPAVKNFLTTVGRVAYDEGSTSLGSFGYGDLGEDQIPVVALPEHPIRAAMLFNVIVVPMLRVMRGRGAQQPLTLTLGTDISRHPQSTTLLLAQITSEGVASPVLRTTPTALDYASADAIIRILPGEGVMSKGSRIPAMRINGGDRDEV